jgi:osmotically-inducible protein OsmY
LTLNSEVPANELDVKTLQGVVNITGTVDNYLAKNEAVKIAKTIRGVRAVIDEIKVAAPVRSDADIRKDVEDALRYDDVTTGLQLTPTVHDGTVLLAGKSPSKLVERAAVSDAMRIKGVREVTSNIEVVHGAPRGDPEIQADVRRALQMDPYVDADFINSEVEKGNVKLSGTVATATERDRSYADAWTSGVLGVNAEALKVDPLSTPDPRKSLVPGPHTDEQVRGALRDALRLDPRILSENVVVAVDGGHVTLAGTVHHLSSKTAAHSDAADTPGVNTVLNLIKVRPHTRPTDEHLAADVRLALMRDARIARFELGVAAKDGVVTLSGTVDYPSQKAEAGYIADQAVGAVEVRSYVLVRFAPRKAAVMRQPNIE